MSRPEAVAKVNRGRGGGSGKPLEFQAGQFMEAIAFFRRSAADEAVLGALIQDRESSLGVAGAQRCSAPSGREFVGALTGGGATLCPRLHSWTPPGSATRGAHQILAGDGARRAVRSRRMDLRCASRFSHQQHADSKSAVRAGWKPALRYVGAPIKRASRISGRSTCTGV
jgi:hypothetical protein